MVKQVIVMRKDLGMRKGKMISQGAHASLKVILDRMSLYNPRNDMDMFEYIHENGCDWKQRRLTVKDDSPLEEWLDGSFTKICLSISSEEELLELYKNAHDIGLPVALITDAGKTEFNGVPTNTCIAIGPANAEDIDRVTGHLKLL